MRRHHGCRQDVKTRGERLMHAISRCRSHVAAPAWIRPRTECWSCRRATATELLLGSALDLEGGFHGTLGDVGQHMRLVAVVLVEILVDRRKRRVHGVQSSSPDVEAASCAAPRAASSPRAQRLISGFSPSNSSGSRSRSTWTPSMSSNAIAGPTIPARHGCCWSRCDSACGRRDHCAPVAR